jgi:hypothetical protein
VEELMKVKKTLPDKTHRIIIEEREAKAKEDPNIIQSNER